RWLQDAASDADRLNMLEFIDRHGKEYGEAAITVIEPASSAVEAIVAEAIHAVPDRSESGTGAPMFAILESPDVQGALLRLCPSISRAIELCPEYPRMLRQ